MGKGYTRFLATMRQTAEGGNSDGISHKSSKKVKKLSSVGKIDQSTSRKRVKLPKKFFYDCHTVNKATIPRKLRSAIKQPHYDSVSPLPYPKDGILRLEKPLEDHNKKLEFNKDEGQHSTISESISEQITKDEEEAIAGLLLLSVNNNTDEINLKTETSDSEDLIKSDVVIEDLNKSTIAVDVKKDCKDFRDGDESRKICSRHVYICRMIKQMQDTKVQTVPLPPLYGNLLYDPSQWPRPPKDQMLMNPFIGGSRYENWQKVGHDETMQPSLVNVLGSKENGGLCFVDSSPLTLNLMCNEHLGSDRSWLNDL